MPARQAFDWGALAGMSFMVGTEGLHWIITPMSHPHASALQTWGVVAQVAGGIGLGIWLFASRRPPAEPNRGPAML